MCVYVCVCRSVYQGNLYASVHVAYASVCLIMTKISAHSSHTVNHPMLTHLSTQQKNSVRKILCRSEIWLYNARNLLSSKPWRWSTSSKWLWRHRNRRQRSRWRPYPRHWWHDTTLPLVWDDQWQNKSGLSSGWSWQRRCCFHGDFLAPCRGLVHLYCTMYTKWKLFE